MTETSIIKIKDSIDLFLSNGRYLMVYYMNTRQRKSFRIDDNTIRLLENIDGIRSVGELIELMQNSYNVGSEYTKQVLRLLHQSRIITEVVHDQGVLSPEKVAKYSRQINYFAEFLGSELEGIVAQKELMDNHILIFGCGSVGGDIALQLAMAGVGFMTLFDYDKVEMSDMSRHLSYREEYLGFSKVEALKAELYRVNPDIKVEIVNDYMKPTTDIDQLINSVDFVVNTLDEPYIGYIASKISRVCMKSKIPHYIAGGFDAHLASTGELIIPYVTPCVECYSSHFKEALKDWKPKKHPVERRFDEIGGLASMSLFSSSYACIEIIKYLTGLIQMGEEYKVRGEFLFRDMSLTYLNVKKNPDCPICGGGGPVES